MKKVIYFSLALSLFFAGCEVESAGHSEIPVQEQEEIPEEKKPLIYSYGLVIDGVTYEKTGEILVMEEEVTVKGTDPRDNDKNHNRVLCFTAGRTITLSPFYICKYEVTQELYKNVMEGQVVELNKRTYSLLSEPSYFKNSINISDNEIQKFRPVESVTWFDAVYFCNVLNEKIGLEKCYEIKVSDITDNHITAADVKIIEGANGFRLPTEHEWQFAARGADPDGAYWDKIHYNSNVSIQFAISNYLSSTLDKSAYASLDKICWYAYNTLTSDGKSDDNSLPNDFNINYVYNLKGFGTHEVGSKEADPLGLFDIYGNVLEWCFDSYEELYSGTVKNPVNQKKADSKIRLGGSWYDRAHYFFHSYSRLYEKSATNHKDVGFRLCRSYIPEENN